MKIDFDALASPSVSDSAQSPDSPAVLQVHSSAWFKPLVLWGAVALSLGLSLYTFFDGATEHQIFALQAKARELEESNQTQQQSLIHLERLLSSLYTSMLEGKFEHSDSPDDVHMLIQVLQDQEKDFQKITQTMKNGMQDLASMLPGSRGWVHYYSEQLDDVARNSRKRTEKLNGWTIQLR